MSTTYRHGTDRCYISRRCRCQPCREAHNAACTRRTRLIAYGQWRFYENPAGTMRRLQALPAIGWSFKHIVEATSLEPCTIRQVAAGRRERVFPLTRDVVAELYEQWSVEDGPSKHSRTWARKRGWLGPEAWSDETIDDPAATPYSWRARFENDADDVAVAWVVSGGRRWQSLTRDADRLDVVRRLSALGLAPGGIASRVGTSTAVIRRYAGLLAAETKAAA